MFRPSDPLGLAPAQTRRLGPARSQRRKEGEDQGEGQGRPFSEQNLTDPQQSQALPARTAGRQVLPTSPWPRGAESAWRAAGVRGCSQTSAQGLDTTWDTCLPGTPPTPGLDQVLVQGGQLQEPPPLSSVPKRPFAPALAFHPPPGPGAGSHPGTRGVEDVCCCRGLRRAHPQDQPGPTHGHLARPLDVEVPGRDARGHGGCRRSRGVAPAPSGEGLPSWGRRRRLGLLFEAAGKAGVQLPGASSRAGSGANPQRAEGKTALSPGPPSQGLTEGKFAVTSDA